MPEAKLDAETLALLRQMLGADEPDDNQSSEEQNDNGFSGGVMSGGVPDELNIGANDEEGGTSGNQDGDSEDFDEDDYDLSSDDFYDDAEDAFAESSEEGVVEPASHVEPTKAVENANQEQSFVPDPIQPATTSSENTETGYEQSSPIDESEPVSPFSSSYGNPIPETEQRQVDTSEQEYQKQSIEEMRQLNAALMAQIAQMQSQLVTMQEFISSNEQKKYNDNARQRVFANEQPFEKITFTPCTSTYNGQSFSYQRYEEPVRYSRRFEICATDEDTAKSYVAFMDEVTKDIEKKFGGFKHINSMAVIDSIIIFNGISYEPLLPEEYTANLPFDIRNAVLDGKFAWLFDFSSLKKMTALTDLKFDSADFVFSKVRKDMHLFGEFNVSKFFKACPSLQRIEIGGDCVTSQDTRAVDEKFHKSSRSEEIYNKCCEFGFGRMKAGWSSIKNVYYDPDRGKLSKVCGITWRGVGTAAAAAGTGAVKGGGLLAKLGKNVLNFTSSLRDNLK